MNKSHESHESHESHDSYLQRMCIWNNTDYSLYKSILTILHKEYYLQNDDIESNINIFGNGMNNKDIINEFIYFKCKLVYQLILFASYQLILFCI